MQGRNHWPMWGDSNNNNSKTAWSCKETPSGAPQNTGCSNKCVRPSVSVIGQTEDVDYCIILNLHDRLAEKSTRTGWKISFDSACKALCKLWWNCVHSTRRANLVRRFQYTPTGASFTALCGALCAHRTRLEIVTELLTSWRDYERYQPATLYKAKCRTWLAENALTLPRIDHQTANNNQLNVIYKTITASTQL